MWWPRATGRRESTAAFGVPTVRSGTRRATAFSEVPARQSLDGPERIAAVACCRSESPPVTPAAKDRLRILAAAALFSTGGAIIKASSLTGWQVACFRSAIGALAILAMAPESRRNWTWRTPLVGLAYAGTVLLFVLANKLTTSANTIFLQSTAPIYLLLLGPWLLKEPLRRRDLYFLGALALGLTLLFVGQEPPRATATDPVLGNLLALASSVTWAFTIIGLRWLAVTAPEGNPASAATVAGNLIAFLIALVVAPVFATT